MTPGVVATLTMHSDLLPLSPDTRAKLASDLDHLAFLLTMYVAELHKGEHAHMARTRFYERVAGLGPALVVTTEP